VKLKPDPPRDPTPGDWIAIDPGNPAAPAILYAMSGPFPSTPRVEPQAWLLDLLDDGRVELMPEGEAVGFKRTVYRVKIPDSSQIEGLP
jgi:hypothetical protein